MTSKQYGFLFDADRCVMCHECELACKGTLGVELAVSLRKVIEIWHGEFPNVRRTFVSLSCLHCAEPPCEQACPSGAISKRPQDGIVAVDRGKCTGCQECFFACPHGVPQFGADGTMQKCDLCLERGVRPACTTSCPAEALFFGTMEELEATAGRKEGKRLFGAHGPSMFFINRRGPTIPESSLTLGKRN